MKPLLLFFALVLLFTSCSNEDPVQNFCLPTRISETRSSFRIGTTEVTQSTWVTTFSYSDNLLQQWSGFNLDDETNVPDAIEINKSIFDANNAIIRQEDESKENIFELEYDGDKRLTSVVYRYKGNIHNTFTFEYNTSGQLIKESYYALRLAVLSLDSYVTFEYPNNITKNFNTKNHFEAGASEPYWVNTYEWDSKKSPYSQLPPLHSADKGTNNITKMIMNYRGGKTELDYMYTYNSNGYPVTRTYIPKEHPELVETFTYEYNCQ
jgi:hypothetical protein